MDALPPPPPGEDPESEKYRRYSKAVTTGTFVVLIRMFSWLLAIVALVLAVAVPIMLVWGLVLGVPAAVVWWRLGRPPKT